MGGPLDKSNAQPSVPMQRARVILLRARETGIPGELSEALHRNNAEPIEVDNALAALAHLCVTRPAVLLLCEPKALAAVPELLTSIERYTHRATLWEYQAGQCPPLRPLTSQAATKETIPPSVAPPPAASRHAHQSDSFALRLSTNPLSAPAASQAHLGEILSREEMEALFSEDPR